MLSNREIVPFSEPRFVLILEIRNLNLFPRYEICAETFGNFGISQFLININILLVNSVVYINIFPISEKFKLENETMNN